MNNNLFQENIEEATKLMGAYYLLTSWEGIRSSTPPYPNLKLNLYVQLLDDLHVRFQRHKNNKNLKFSFKIHQRIYMKRGYKSMSMVYL